MRTLLPTMTYSPSGDQARVKASPSPLTSLRRLLVLTSQNLTVPSLLTLHNSSSLTGLKATFSMGAACPFSPVDWFTFGLSTFPGIRHGQTVVSRARPGKELMHIQTRSVLSAQPVAIQVPRGFQAMERMLEMYH